ncbi:ATPase inhibitor, IATP, mitochondria family-containing protein [Strongyloides ratti]|uniref:ATPase inhibitor, mitochondrial n=1 Tax=Strongyloides ratti TaxID=34506 RepID=A0A090KY03_STRRB|nr:ATPase inhibitor, IATP, mitochondria family-containing protein [Strongyloides ratti]CEF62400.1 ATPase inhibitor, IATP, mitochondria family-containing protein [Strongyloides ratti]
MSSGNVGSDIGSGVGRGGGAGGSIREGGGAFGKLEAAREEEYFYKLSKEQIQKMHDHLVKEIDSAKEQAKKHNEAIKRNEDMLKALQDHSEKYHE